MAERRAFDMAKLTTADKILLGGGALLFVDSFLSWQRVCVTILQLIGGCVRASAWGGNGSFFGVVMAITALALVAIIAAGLAGVEMPPTLPVDPIRIGLVIAVFVSGVIKFLLVVGKAASYGTWVGLVLIVAIAYGGYMKSQERRVLPPPAGGTLG